MIPDKVFGKTLTKPMQVHFKLVAKEFFSKIAYVVEKYSSREVNKEYYESNDRLNNIPR